MEKSDAIVTIQILIVKSHLLKDAAIPIPKERTSGTVTGPEVTAPQSHAKPNIVLKSGLLHAYNSSNIVGVVQIN